MTKFSTVAAALIFAAAAIPTAAVAQTPAPAASAAPAGAVVKVKGLVCDFCVQALNRTFRRQAAVRDFAVNLDSHEIRMTFKPGSIMDDATIRRLVTDAGYNVVGISRTGGAS